MTRCSRGWSRRSRNMPTSSASGNGNCWPSSRGQRRPRARSGPTTARPIYKEHSFKDESGFDFKKYLGRLKVLDPSKKFQLHYLVKLSVEATDDNVETGPGRRPQQGAVAVPGGERERTFGPGGHRGRGAPRPARQGFGQAARRQDDDGRADQQAGLGRRRFHAGVPACRGHSQEAARCRHGDPRSVHRLSPHPEGAGGQPRPQGEDRQCRVQDRAAPGRDRQIRIPASSTWATSCSPRRRRTSCSRVSTTTWSPSAATRIA